MLRTYFLLFSLLIGILACTACAKDDVSIRAKGQSSIGVRGGGGVDLGVRF